MGDDAKEPVEIVIPPPWIVTQASCDLGEGRRMLVWSEPNEYAWRVWAPGREQRTGKARTIAVAKRDATRAARALGWL